MGEVVHVEGSYEYVIASLDPLACEPRVLIGSTEDNASKLEDKARQAIANLESADANWATLTAAQKDQALRLCVRVVAKLARLVVRQLDSA